MEFMSLTPTVLLTQRKGPTADEYNVHKSDDKIAQEGQKQNGSFEITKLKKSKLGKVLMEKSIKKGTYFIHLIKGEMDVFFFSLFLFHERIEKENLT